MDRKLALLQDAYQKGRIDLAMSLAESIKNTLSFERTLQAQHNPNPSPIESASLVRVRDLPGPWARWAQAWKHCYPLQLRETKGIPRIREPVIVNLVIAEDHMIDPWREIRVARIRPETGAVESIPCQILSHFQSDSQHHCRLVFQATSAAFSTVDHLVFFDNPNAERPEYHSDLTSRGKGEALQIDNHYFTANLSSQMGQLERLISKRQHGLELFAGGKGHGEPPSIDWAHDYVDEGHFQKLRIKNWARSPNFEVIRGPVCLQVRRWGFPHSPVHPLFTPSRMHIDQTYTFYSNLPYFFKEGTMEAIVDLKIAAMRDDEWVFSGYAFDETLWIDRNGTVHEGKVTSGHENDLWGVGFFHRPSRDAFIALWLEHDAKGFPEIQHGGAPTLQYEGHGQLWSRYPANEASLKQGTVFRQRNAYLMTEYPETGGKEALERLREQLLHPLELSSAGEQAREEARAVGSLARPGETAAAGGLKDRIWQALRSVQDEQLYQVDANIVDMGYVYDVRVSAGVVTVVVTMPHPGRPVFQFLETQGGGRVSEGIRERLRKLEGVSNVVVQSSNVPAWSIHRMTDRGRSELGFPSH